jgi:hypothetical protein
MTTSVYAAPILESRSSMSGEATFYNVGLGSCGQTNSPSEMVAALSTEVMSNDYCGRSITVHGNKGSVTVKVVDSVSCKHKVLIGIENNSFFYFSIIVSRMCCW